MHSPCFHVSHQIAASQCHMATQTHHAVRGRPRVNLWPAGSGQSEVHVSFIFSLPLCGLFADVITEKDGQVLWLLELELDLYDCKANVLKPSYIAVLCAYLFF